MERPVVSTDNLLYGSGPDGSGQDLMLFKDGWHFKMRSKTEQDEASIVIPSGWHLAEVF